MKNTPNINGQNANGAVKNGQNGATHVIKPGEVVNLSDALKKMNGSKNGVESEEQPADVTPVTAAPAPVETPPVQPVPTEAPASVVTPPIDTTKPARSRMEEIQYWNDKVQQMNLVNRQLGNLTKKRDDLNDFSFSNEESEDYRYGRVVIYDDNNNMFECRNHGVACFVVEQLKTVFAEKIEIKENDLLRIAQA